MIDTGAAADAADSNSEFLSRCLKTGKQELLQGRVFSAESISKPLYETAWKLASYKELLAANQANGDYEANARAWVEAHPDLVAEWLGEDD